MNCEKCGVAIEGGKRCLNCEIHICKKCNHRFEKPISDVYKYCDECCKLRKKTCGELAIAFSLRTIHWYNRNATSPPRGCGAVTECLDELGICDTCANTVDHTCSKCAKVVSEELHRTQHSEYYLCNNCYAATKCIHCKYVLSKHPIVSQHKMCDKCFVIFERCCVCKEKLRIPYPTDSEMAVSIQSRIDAITGKSLCYDCLESERHM